MKSHALSKKAIERLGLHKQEKDPLSEVVKKEWTDPEEYFKKWEDDLEDHHAGFWNKVKNFFVYNIGWRTKDFWYDMKWYFHNLKTFQPVLKTWRSFDYHYQVDLFKFGIQQLINAMEYYGNTEEHERNKCIDAMKTLIAEIDRDYEDELSEKMGKTNRFQDNIEKVIEYEDGSVMYVSKKDKKTQKSNNKFYAALKKERKAHYDKIFNLILGQDADKLQDEVEKQYNALSDEEKTAKPEDELKYEIYNKLYDGSGIEGWWD